MIKANEGWCLWIKGYPVRGTGPVSLIQLACKAAGMVIVKPQNGDTYLDPLSHKWETWKLPFPSKTYCPVIPADPEPAPCSNCQNVKPGQDVVFNKEKAPWGWHAVCAKCGKLYTEWTYAEKPDPAKDCPNCQNVKYRRVPYQVEGYPENYCPICNRPVSE